jgi:predicted methyltransferase MtxX (methanogen marker protein 4)
LFRRPAFFNHDPGQHTYILIDDPMLDPAELIIEGDSVLGKLTFC